MSDRIDSILVQMRTLEEDFYTELKSYEAKLRVEFTEQSRAVRRAVSGVGQKLDASVSTGNWRHYISIPFIYSMIVPLAFLDITISIYQAVCFRLYGIARVRRSQHVVIDRHLLANLTGIDKFNCIYCGYGNGVISYAREIISKTEQYWCPIKHAKEVRAAAERYSSFLEYGDTDDYHEKLADYRDSLRREVSQPPR